MLINWNTEFEKLAARMGNVGKDPKIAYDEVIKVVRQPPQEMKSRS